MKKRLIAILLSLMMVVSVLPVSALAADDDAEQPAEQAAETQEASPEDEDDASVPEDGTETEEPEEPEEPAEEPEESADETEEPAEPEEEAEEPAESEAEDEESLADEDEAKELLAGEKDSGKIGTDIDWVLYDTGVLTLTGTGATGDYSAVDTAPWYQYKADITEVIVKSGITYIGKYAFNGCENLTKVTLADSVTGIGEYALNDCSSFSSMTALGVQSFENVLVNCGEVTVGYEGSGCDVTVSFGTGTIIAENNLASIQGIGGSESCAVDDFVFANCDAITAVELPDGLTSIGEEAFFCCTSLKEIVIPNSCTGIGEKAFMGCDHLTTVTLRKGIKYIPESCFESCTRLEKVRIGNDPDVNLFGVGIGLNAFKSCSSLKYVHQVAGTYYWYDYASNDGNDTFRNATISNRPICEIDGHDGEKTDSKAATCTSEGNIAYWTCLKCGKLFSDATCTESISSIDQTVVKKTDHTKTYSPAVEPTLDHTGQTEGYYCSVCHTVLSGMEVIPALTKVDEYVENLYVVALGRTPNSDEVSYWSNRLVKGKETGSSLTYTFLFGDEFKDRNVCAKCYVKILYYGMLQRTSATSAEIAEWVDKLTDHQITREGLFAVFAASDEFKTLCKDLGIAVGTCTVDTSFPGTESDGTCSICGAVSVTSVTEFVTRMYNEVLNRAPDEGGLKYWTNALTSKTKTGMSIAYDFVFSDEFKALNLCNECFVSTLYYSMMGRTPDSGGLTWWTGKLTNFEMTREHVLNCFVESDEFKDICNRYGINAGTAVAEPSGLGTQAIGSCTYCGADNVNSTDGFVRWMYNYGLETTPTAAELYYWTTRLENEESTGTDVVKGIMLSEEMNAKNNTWFVNHMYYSVLCGEPSDTDRSWWVKQLATGKYTREALIDFFVAQDAFTQLCNKFEIPVK